MADLVDDDVDDELIEADARRAPFGEDRPREEGDPLRQHARLADALPVERNALVKSAELHRMAQAEAARGLGVGNRLDQEHYVSQAIRERRGQALERSARDLVDVRVG